VYELDSAHLLYTKPIVINNALCLNCHGEVGAAVTEETYALIREKYPNDNATGHQMGDLRGMWSITFSKFSYLLKKDEE
jgi:cytochrome c